MTKRLKYAVIGSAIIISLFLAFRFLNNPERKIIDEWEVVHPEQEVGIFYTFYEDGTLTIANPSGISVTGDYTFVDRDHIRYDLGLGQQGVYEVYFANNYNFLDLVRRVGEQAVEEHVLFRVGSDIHQDFQSENP